MADNQLYETLGVSRGASDTEIRREYHKLAKRYHPDKNAGNDDKFKEVQGAYEILSDPQKRQIYDRFGMDAVKGESSGGMGGMAGFPFGDGGPGGPGGIFSQFFGGGGSDLFGAFGGGGRKRRPKGETVGMALEVTLEELYNGATKYAEHKRKERCETCNGVGGKQGSVTRCRKCQGSGIEVKLRQIGPGMMQQMQAKCSDCSGSGDFIREKDKCKKCKGKKVLDVEHRLEVPVTPGMQHEQKIPFRGQGDYIPDGDPGDVIVVLQQMDHVLFKRKGLDLFVEKKITLGQALCGFKFGFEHLDGRKMLLVCEPREVISPGTVKGLENEGMCNFKHNNVYGNLYFIFDVEFPPESFINEQDMKALEELLPKKPKSPLITDSMEEVTLMDIEGTRGENSQMSEAYDDDDDEDGHHHGPGGVGCQQQ